MSFLNTVRNFFTAPEDEYPYDNVGMSDYAAEHQPREGRVVQVDQAPKPHRLTIYSPKSFDEAQHPALDIKSGTTTIVNFHRLNPADAERISYFLQGVVFALNGEFTKVADSTLVFAPNHMGIVNKADLAAQAQQGNSSFQNPLR